LCGIGVTSLIEATVTPFACKDLTAASRPAPTPFTKTSTSCKPYSLAFSTAFLTIIPAAYGVAFFGPLKPFLPAEDHPNTSPF